MVYSHQSTALVVAALLTLFVQENHAFAPPLQFASATMKSTFSGSTLLLPMVSTDRRHDTKDSTPDVFLDEDESTPNEDYKAFHLSLQQQQPQQETMMAEVIVVEDSSLDIIQEDEEQRNKKLGIWAARGLLLFIAILWGTNFATVKYVQALCFHPPCVHPPSETALARFGVAAAVSLPFLIGQKKDVILGGLECGLWISLGYITQALALKEIDAGTCAFICSLTVVSCPALSFLLQGKTPKPTQMIAAVVALMGVGILEGMVDTNALLGIPAAIADTGSAAATAAASSSSAMATAASVDPLGTVANLLGVHKGDIIAFGQPLGFGYAFMRVEHYVEKFKNEKNQVITLSAAQCVTVGFMSLLWVLYDYHGVIPNMEYLIEPHRIAAILWTGIVTTVVAINLQAVALQTATATDAALTFASEPVWASLFGVWLLKEKLDTNAYVGGAVILMACVIGAVADFNVGGDKTKEMKQAEEVP